MPEPERAPRRLVFVDTEYTNLDTALADVVDVAYAGETGAIVTDIPPHTLANADPQALKVNRYYERDLGDRARWNPAILDDLTRSTAGQTIVGANPRVDAAVLAARIGYEPWHYRLGDIESAAWLLLGFEQIPGLRQIRDRLVELGYQIPEPDHTAAGDVHVTRACFQVMKAIAEHLRRHGLPTAAELDTEPTQKIDSVRS